MSLGIQKGKARREICSLHFQEARATCIKNKSWQWVK
jgi:hypothetical protein